ncbi:hypothetical protein EH223_05430 [candidate division KSB1 bacterium]|nr:hypothetical protein [candidate division KSB1 bacterium]RQW05204.1 MAG: hypothetical protein EH223_05430 [candidate division KSB1 bacterium]
MLHKVKLYLAVILTCSLLAMGSIALFLSCDQITPPYNPPGDEPVEDSSGSIGDTLKTEIELFSNNNTGDWSIETQFFDNSQKIGQGNFYAAQDLVAEVSLNNFNIPGTTVIQLGNYMRLQVVVSQSATPSKYLVVLTNLDNRNMEPVSFVINKIEGLTKTATTTSINNAAAVDPGIFSAFVATHSVMLLCRGPLQLVKKARECLETAKTACGSLNNVEEVYIELRFSLITGCGEIRCVYTCGEHDQGSIGS